MNKPFPLPPHPDPTTHHWPWGTVPPGPGARWLVTQGRCPVLHSLYLLQSIPVPTPLCSELPSWSHIADGETEVWRGVVTSSQSCGLAGAERGGWISPAYRPSGPGQSEDHPPPLREAPPAVEVYSELNPGRAPVTCRWTQAGWGPCS